MKRHAVLLATTMFMLVPFAVMVAFAFSPSDPSQPFHGWENFARALNVVPFGRFMLNGAIVALVVCVLQIAIAAPCAYALAKLEFRGRDVLFGLIVLSLMVPPQVLALPLFLLFNRLHLIDTYGALILPWIVSPFAIFLLRQVFKSIPDDLLHAARLDGFSELAIVWRLMLPLAAPTVAAFAILSIVSRWNNLFWPSIAVSSESLMPPTLGILYFRNDEAGDEYGPLMAAAILVVLPLVAWFLCAQRRFIAGLSLGAVK